MQLTGSRSTLLESEELQCNDPRDRKDQTIPCSKGELTFPVAKNIYLEEISNKERQNYSGH